MQTVQDSNRPLFAVLEAVEEREGTDVEALPPLGNSIDPDALDRLFGPTYDGAPRDGGIVRFPYAGYEVAVRSDGNVELFESER